VLYISYHVNQQHNSPALRRADMGIAMAITGSEVSREAASLVLLDDRFASVVEGIKRGRIIFASMKKVCTTILLTATSSVLSCYFSNCFVRYSSSATTTIAAHRAYCTSQLC
jgi:magnesium-transporting ATPase (P-type)